MKSITDIIGGAQALLDISYDLQDCFEESLTNEYKTFLQLLRVVETYLKEIPRPYAGTGRRPYPYMPYLRGEIAKRYFHLDTTKDLIQRLKGEPNLRLLCGLTKVPDKSSFSRALAYLSNSTVLNDALDALVTDAHKGLIVYHVCRDSTAIAAREKPSKKPAQKVENTPKKRGRPSKNTPKPPREPTVLEKQTQQSAVQSLTDISKTCAWGCKKNSEGHIHVWKGYKLHLDVSDTGFPLSACVSAANVHDSRLAIPLEKLTERKVTFLYSLMDSAYDAAVIEGFIRGRGRIPIIDPNKRNDPNKAPLDPAKQARYKIRTTVERAYSDLKDNFIPKAMYVKGYLKVSFVLMSAILSLAAIKYSGPI